MRGVSTGGGGSVVDKVLKLAPIACAFFAFLFMAIALSSGIKPNYLEGLSIVNVSLDSHFNPHTLDLWKSTNSELQFNMSTLGKNLIKIPDVSDAAKDGCNKAGNTVNDVTDKIGDGIGGIANVFGGGGDKVSDAVDKAGDTVGGATTDACNKGAEIADQAVQLTKDVIDKVMGSIAKAIGIKEYYSVHIGVLCEGEYDPLFSDKDAKPNVQKCSRKFNTEKTDLSKKLDEELQVGPFKFKLSDLDLVEAIQQAFDLIPRALAAMAFFFLFAILALVAGLVLSVLKVAFEHKQNLKKFALLGSMGFMGFGWFTSIIGVIGVTVVAEKVKKAINEHGDKFGMSAATSPGLYFLLWASLLFSTVAFALLCFVWWRDRNGNGMAARGEKTESSMEDSHGFARMPTSGGQQQFREEPL